MATPNEIQLHDMGLTPQTPADDTPGWGAWTRKAEIHAAIVASDQPNKPTGDLLWKTAKEAIAVNMVTCNMCIHTARLTAIVTGGATDGTDKVLDEEIYICKKESAVWIKQYLTFSSGENKANQHLKQASNKENYSVSQYNSYVPLQVRAASDVYITKYFNKHKPTNQRLTKAMIEISFTSFKCDLPMMEQEEIDEHINNVHGVEGGVTTLKPVQIIEVDTKIAFTLPSLLEIELVGPDKRTTMINSVFTRSVARNIINKTSNKNTADLNLSRSKDFMTELGKSTPNTFFARFKMHLNELLKDEDINEDFTCKWSDIETALYKAISKEQNIVRLSNFFDKDYDQFHSQPLELIIDQVETHVNSVLGKSTAVHKDAKGRTLSDYTYTLKTKYKLIFTIVRHLNGDFKQIKDYIMQLIANMYDDIKLLVDIQDFQTNLKAAFETKGLLSSYKNDNIPAPKKSMAIHEAKVKVDKKDRKDREDTPAGLKAFNADYLKAKLSAKDDTDLKKEVTTLATKLAEDPQNADAKIGLHKEIQDLMKLKKKRVCWGCRSANCFIRQNLSNTHNIKKKFSFTCKGKQIAFKELAGQLKDSQTESNTASAQVKSPAAVNDDSDSDDLANAFANMNTLQTTRNDEFGYRDCVTGFETNIITLILHISHSLEFSRRRALSTFNK